MRRGSLAAYALSLALFEASSRIMATLQRRARFVPRFRQLAMGDDPEEHLLAIFGTLPAKLEPRHGDTLDAE